MQLLRTIIIEDEIQSQIVLNNMLKAHGDVVEVIGIFDTVAKAVAFLREHEVDLLFLDIELPNESGFSLFEYYCKPHLKVIFTTAYNQYALQAFRLSAVDYLLKPLDRQDLKEALLKVQKLEANARLNEAYKLLLENLQAGNSRLAISHQNGYDIVETDDILWLEADVNYTTIHLKSKRNVTVAKTLRVFEDSLDPANFFRISRGAIVNVDSIIRLNRSAPLSVTLCDQSTLPVSDSRKDEFLNLYKKI